MHDEELMKLEKKIGTEKANSYRGMTTDELDKELFRLAKYREEVHESQKNDVKLTEAKDKVKFMNAPYNETKRALSNQARFVYLTLLEKGGA